MIRPAPLRRLVSWQRRPWKERWGVFPTWVLLGLARLSIVLLPFSLIRPLLGGGGEAAAWLHWLADAQEQRARRVGRLILFATRYCPWTANCFPQALTARVMLSLLGIPHVVFFGLRREEGRMQAHTWVMAGRVAVTGGPAFSEYTLVGCFVITPRYWAARWETAG